MKRPFDESEHAHLAYSPKRRINEQGDYLEFHGVNVISLVESCSQNSIWAKIYNTLKSSRVITEHYSLLPYSSYHMTTNNLYTESSPTQHWSEYIGNYLNFYQELNVLLTDHYYFIPQVVAKGFITNPVLQIHLELPTSQKEKVYGLARQLKIEHLVPNFFHITLAYQYKSPSQGAIQEIAQFFQNQVKALFQNAELKLQAPRLCFFKNMTHFEAWDAQYNPFESVDDQSDDRDRQGHSEAFSSDQSVPQFDSVG